MAPRPIRPDGARKAFIDFSKQRKVSLLKWAKAADVHPNSIYNWLAGRANELSVESLRRLAGVFEVSIEEILGGHAPPRGPLARTIPVIDYVQAGHWREIIDAYQPGEGMAEITVDIDVGPNAFALEVRGESMQPEFREGDRIIVDPDQHPHPGQFAVAKLERSDEATFKRYTVPRLDKKQRPIVELVPLNSAFPTLTLDATNPGRIIGKVVGHHRYWR